MNVATLLQNVADGNILPPSQPDHQRRGGRGVEVGDVGGAALEYGALVQRTLVGDFAGVDGRRFGQQRQPDDAGR